jgi:hypothetical protein
MPFDVTLPLDNQTLSSAPGVIRSNFAAINTTIGVDHHAMGTASDGKHTKVTLTEGAKPAAVANAGILYTKDTGGNAELFYENQAGTEVQITSDGSIAGEHEILNMKSGADGSIAAASGKNLYIIGGDAAGVNKFSFMSSQVITAISQANPAAVTSVAHGLTTGDVVRIINVEGMVEVNNLNFTVTKSTDDVFTLNATDSTGYTAYTSGGRFCKEVSYITTLPYFTSWVITKNGTAMNKGGNIASVSRLSQGRYRITFTTPYTNIDKYGIIGTVYHTNATLRSLVPYSKNVAYVDVASVDRVDSSQDNDFSAIVINY